MKVRLRRKSVLRLTTVLCLKTVLTLAAILVPLRLAADDSPHRMELQAGWRIMSAKNVPASASQVSQPGYDASGWYPVAHMPSTVLQALQDAGVYKNLYYGMNLSTPGPLWKEDWWYRTTFPTPATGTVHTLIFKGINYRAEVWLNGHQVARPSQAVGMYNQFEWDVTQLLVAGGENVLAVKITPERAILGEGEIELADSWHDWINWKYLGSNTPPTSDVSYVPDRNAGVWKRVYLSSTGAVTIRSPYVSTDLPLPALSPAALSVYCDIANHSAHEVQGTLRGEISRPGKPAITFEKHVALDRGETREISITPADVQQLSIPDPDLWWPYQWGKPNLYHLQLEFRVGEEISDTQTIDFGIRTITQARDSDTSFPEIGKGGSFYLQINGRNFLVRGGVYSPDLLYRNDPEHDATIIRYAKDLGLNFLRWESKIADESMLDLADREGIPIMLGWMCCSQWEHWDSWTAEDQWVARASLRATLRDLRSHASVVAWANGSDGLPPDPLLNDYNQILRELHWPNAILNTVSSFNRTWSGIHMYGPYVWRPPYFWFSEKYGNARGSSAEEGDNETIPPVESLRKFIPEDKLWPPNEYWYFHSGANDGNNTLANVQRLLNQRYGPSHSVEEFSRKAQLAHYEDVRAQFEAYATHWDNRKMLVHWMMNNPWPSFFGHLFDYYFKQGGGYFGAKKALRPLTVVWDYYATGDRNSAKVYLVNLTQEPKDRMNVSVEVYNLDGKRPWSNEVKGLHAEAGMSIEALTMPRISNLSSVFFVRCQLKDDAGTVLAENTYWASNTNDDLGSPKDYEQFKTELAQWADFSALNTLAPVKVQASGTSSDSNDVETVTLTLSNNSPHIAFFLRAELSTRADGDEILPISYDDNYITLFPHQTRVVTATFKKPSTSGPTWLKVEGYNVAKFAVSLASK
jgi:exo-1,4-beta-D-glucosaminidase